MTAVIIPIVTAGFVLLGIEGLRWMLRPESRRLRMLRKISGRR